MRAVEAERVGDHPVEGLDLAVVAVEEGEEAGLRAGRPLDAEEPEFVQPTLDVVEVEDRAHNTRGRPLADRHELGRLVVGVAEAGQIAMLEGERAKGVDRPDQAGRGRA